MPDSSLAVLLRVTEGVAHIVLNRPQVLNAVDRALAEGLRNAVREAVGRQEVRVIVLSGEGRAFAAGGDLAYFRDATTTGRSEAAQALIEPMHDAITQLAAAPQPVIACLQGAVAGAGMSLALATDLAIAADDTVFSMAYIKVAAPPDCSASWSLPRLVGLRKALEIALLGDRIEATEALRLGLVNRVVARARLADECQALAQRLAASAPLALGHIKRLMRSSQEHSLSTQLAQEQEAFASNAATRDFDEALAAFFGKRAPRFEGR